MAGRERIIAEAHYVRGRDVQAAEFAVSVAASWQGKGLATTMLGDSPVARPPPACGGLRARRWRATAECCGSLARSG